MSHFSILNGRDQSRTSIDTYTFDEALELAGFGCFQWKLLFRTGWITAFESSEMLKMVFLVPILQDVWKLDMWESNMIGVSTFGGIIVGGLVVAKLSDIYGRRKVIKCCTGLFALFSFASGFTTSSGTFMLCSFLTSFANTSVVGCTLLMEFSPKKWRARSMVMWQIFWMMGCIHTVLLSWVILPHFTLELGWRVYIFASATTYSIVAFGAQFVPESVRYFCTIGDVDNATKVIENMLQTNGAGLMQGSLAREEKVAVRGAVTDLFDAKNRSTTIVLMHNYFVFGLVYFGVIFISEHLFLNASLYLSELIITMAEIPAIFIALLIDKTGRKGMMVITLITNFIFASIAAVLWYFDLGDTWLKYLTVAIIFSSRCSSHVYITALIAFINEYYPTAIRSSAYGFLKAIGRSGSIAGFCLWWDLDIVSGLTVIALLCLFSLPLQLFVEDTSNKQLCNSVEKAHGQKEIKSLTNEPNLKKYVII